MESRPASARSSTLAHGDVENKSQRSKASQGQDGQLVDEPSTPVESPTHDPRAGDPSFPFASTNINEAGMTDEYRVVSPTGMIAGDTALRPIPSNHSVTPPALRDPEMQRELKNVKLVTFVPNDPEDPRNWSKLFRWCTSSLLHVRVRLLTHDGFIRYHGSLCDVRRGSCLLFLRYHR